MKVVIEKEFEYKGFECIVTLAVMGHRCGYVNVKNTKYEGVDYRFIEEDIDVHGGLTYSYSRMHGREKSEGDWWLGWDYAHYGDGIDLNAVIERFPEETEYIKFMKEMERLNELYDSMGDYVSTVDDVVNDCKSVVEQIIRLETGESESEVNNG